MKQFGSELVDRLEEGVASVEDGNQLEIVIRIVPWSGSYRDAAYACGIALALVALVGAIYSPVSIDPLLLPLARIEQDEAYRA